MKNPTHTAKTINITKQTPLRIVAEIGKECDKCNHCCKMDTGIVLEEDISRIAKHLNISEEKLKEQFLVEHEKFNTPCYKLKQVKAPSKPYGRCIFLDETIGCKIHEVKPLHCKVCSTKSLHGEKLVQWFALNYLVKPHDPESIRQWAVFLQFQEPIPGGKLDELVPDKLKLQKILSYELLK